MTNKVQKSFERLALYCEREGYKGFDPYDGLNSSLFRSLPVISKNRLARLIWIQAFKRSPFNLRGLTGVRKEYNPKALGLFLSGYSNLYKQTSEDKYLQKIHFFTSNLTGLRN